MPRVYRTLPVIQHGSGLKEAWGIFNSEWDRLREQVERRCVGPHTADDEALAKQLSETVPELKKLREIVPKYIRAESISYEWEVSPATTNLGEHLAEISSACRLAYDDQIDVDVRFEQEQDRHARLPWPPSCSARPSAR